MAEKRKDKNGTNLRAGESQRKDRTYQFRYTSPDGKTRYVYAKTLDKLREKELVIQRDLLDGIDYRGGEVSVSELVTRYMGTRRNFSKNTLRAYGSAVNHITSSELSQQKIKDIKQSDAKRWFISLHDSGMKQHTIEVIQNVLRPAFEMAVNDDALRKNPFKFSLSDIVPDDAYKRDALSKTQQQKYLQFLSDNKSSYYDEVVILLGTGIRVSELYGLTRADVDMSNRCIRINKQLCRTAENPYFVTSPKTKSGIRTIPMTDSVHQAFTRVIKNRGAPKLEMNVDGHIGFLFLDKHGKPKVAMHLENHMRHMGKKYAKQNPHSFPSVTPHILRHTFCTNAQRAGMDVKTLQYLMGHSNVSVTLDVYAHADYESVKQVFKKVAGSL